jgi:hypothetical protein
MFHHGTKCAAQYGAGDPESDNADRMVVELT